MIKRTVTYTDLDENEITEEFLFNLTKAEVVKLEMSTPGGFSKALENLEVSRDGKKIIEALETLFRSSFGRRSSEGKFIKRSDFWDEFVASEPYSDLFMSIATDPTKFEEFVNGIMPKELVDEARKTIEASASEDGDQPKTPRVLTKAEQREMDPAELRRGLVSGEYELETVLH